MVVVSAQQAKLPGEILEHFLIRLELLQANFECYQPGKLVPQR